MPLGRYFAFMGGALLALLFITDWYMPGFTAEPDRAGVDKSIIRIHSAHRWPEAVAFDTSLPTIIPPATAAELPAQKPLHDALALLPQPAPAAVPASTAEAKPVMTKKRVRIARASTRRIATYRAPGSLDLFAAGW